MLPRCGGKGCRWKALGSWEPLKESIDRLWWNTMFTSKKEDNFLAGDIVHFPIFSTVLLLITSFFASFFLHFIGIFVLSKFQRTVSVIENMSTEFKVYLITDHISSWQTYFKNQIWNFIKIFLHWANSKNMLVLSSHLKI